jgi:hypothetical protein
MAANTCSTVPQTTRPARNTRGARLVKLCLAAEAIEEQRIEANRVASAVLARKSTATMVPEELVDLVNPLLHQRDIDCDTDDSEDDMPNIKLVVKNLKSPFAKEDILPRHQKRRASSVSPNAKTALKHLRAKRSKTDLSPNHDPPSPYRGILNYF